MNVVVATMIVILVGMFCGFIIKIYSIYKGKPMPKDVVLKLLDIFAIIPRGFVGEIKVVMKIIGDPKERLRALINVILVILFLIASMVSAIVLLICAPFGGQLCVACAFGLLVLGILTAAFITELSVRKVL